MRLVILFLTIAFSSSAQSDQAELFGTEPSSENFEAVTNMSVFTSEQIDKVRSLHSNYKKSNVDTAKLLAEKVMEITKEKPANYVHAQALIMLGISLDGSGNYDEAEKIQKRAQSIAKKIGEEKLIAETNYRLAWLDNKRDKYDTAIDYFLSAVTSYEKLKDSISIFNTYYSIAGVYYNLSIINKTEEYTKKATDIAETTNDERMKMQIYGAQTNIYNRFSEKYYQLANTDSVNKELYLDTLYYYYNKEIENGEKRLMLAKKINNKKVIANTLISLIGVHNNKMEYEKAISYGEEVEKIIEKIGDLDLKSQFNNFIAISYVNAGKPQLALAYAKESLAIAEELGRERRVGLSHDYLHKVYEILGRHDKALKHLKVYHRYLEKTNDLEKNKLIADAEAKFQTAKKENQILELESANAKIEKQRNFIMGGVLFFSVFGILGFQLNKTRKERNEKKAFAEALIFAQEEERKRIARDLHDGVGQSLLLIKKQLENTHDITLENKKMISNTLEEVRSISRDLHPFQLEKFGITATINDAIYKVEKATDLFITKEIENVDGLISEKSAIHLFRTVQEALSNIVKHARATAAKVSVKKDDQSIKIKIQDNGNGFDHELAVVTSKSLGLRTMHERISAIGGKLIFGKNNTSGTVVEIVVPKSKMKI